MGACVERGHLSRNILNYLALLFALTSTAWAASTALLPANSVGTRQVINRSLLGIDLKQGQAPAGSRGIAGVYGEVGATGAAGVPGVAGVAGLQVVEAGSAGSPSADATCPAGKKVVGGGVRLLGWSVSPALLHDHPLEDGSGWRAFYGPLTSFVVYAVCAFTS